MAQTSHMQNLTKVLPSDIPEPIEGETESETDKEHKPKLKSHKDLINRMNVENMVTLFK